MERSLFAIAVFSASILLIVSANEQFFQGLRDSVANTNKKLTATQIQDLDSFKNIVVKGVDNRLGSISEESLVAGVVEFLEKKLGEYPASIAYPQNQEKYLHDYMEHIAKPCETLDKIWIFSLSSYSARSQDKEAVKAIKADSEINNLLEDANVCSSFLKTCDETLMKSLRHLISQKLDTQQPKKSKTFFHRIFKARST